MSVFLVIDDDNDIRDNIKEIFKLSGIDVITASSGLEGIRLAREIIPDLIICDIAMPILDGFDVKRTLDQNEKCASIPFVFLTAQTDFNIMRNGMNLGADDFITKPVRTSELLHIVNQRLKRIGFLNNYFCKNTNTTKSIYNDKIFINKKNEIIIFELKEIILINVIGDYTQVFSNDNKKIMIKRSLKVWSNILPNNTFVKVSRNIIINLDYVEKIEQCKNGIFTAKMKGPIDIIRFSKRQSILFKKNQKLFKVSKAVK